jgi:hypothetical protein
MQYIFIYLIIKYIILKTDDTEAFELIIKNFNYTTRKCIQCLLLSHQGRTIIELAIIFDFNH